MPNNDMTAAVRRPQRNQSIEVCRLIAAIFVIFIHCRFPGDLGEVMDCLARFAVPFFFLVSGYYVYQADGRTIGRRTAGMLKLNIWATVLYLLWGTYKQRYIIGGSRYVWIMERISAPALTKWLVIGENPFSFHLWYLTVMAVCYAAVLLYVRWWEEKQVDYRPLYLVGVLLYAVHILQGSISVVAEDYVPFSTYRNALFFGLPMFILGIFLHEYQEKLLRVYALNRKKLALLILAGALLSVMQWLGSDGVEMPLGTLVEVIALMLLLVRTPRIAGNSRLGEYVIARCSRMSVCIYIVHPICRDVYNTWLKPFFRNTGDIRPYLETIGTMVLSVAAAVLWCVLCDAVKKKK